MPVPRFTLDQYLWGLCIFSCLFEQLFYPSVFPLKVVDRGASYKTLHIKVFRSFRSMSWIFAASRNVATTPSVLPPMMTGSEVMTTWRCRHGARVNPAFRSLTPEQAGAFYQGCGKGFPDGAAQTPIHASKTQNLGRHLVKIRTRPRVSMTITPSLVVSRTGTVYTTSLRSWRRAAAIARASRNACRISHHWEVGCSSPPSGAMCVRISHLQLRSEPPRPHPELPLTRSSVVEKTI